MRVNYQVNATPLFRVLSEDQIEEIYLATLEVLARTGTRVYEEEALALLREGGAVISDTNLVRIPSFMVRAALDATPERITLTGRDGKKKVLLEKDHIYFGTGSDCPFVADPYTDERRRFTYQDVYNAAKITDALPNIDFHMSLGLTSDVPIGTYDRHQFLAMASGTTKPLVITAVDREGLADQYQMACAILGGEDEWRKNPLFVVYIEPSSPLSNSEDAVQKVLYAAEKGIPAIYTPCPIGGATATATLAGVLVQGLAECLVGVVIAQLKKKGTPVIVGGVASIMDMASTILCYGAPELHLLSAAYADIAKWLRIPIFSTAGCSDAKVLDQQAAIESAISITMAALSGANLIHDVGYLGQGKVGNPASILMGDELISYVKRIARGFDINEETLAFDMIRSVGPGGHYLAEKHTIRHHRQELWRPNVANRENMDIWVEQGSKSYEQRLAEEALKILDTHHPEPLPDEAAREIDEIAIQAEEALASIAFEA